MTGRRDDLPDIKALLQARIDALVYELLPDGYKSGRYWMAKNPRRNDSRAGSFVVWLRGSAPGAWRDYATDDKGDVIGLIQFALGLELRLALDWARGWLGLAQATSEELRDRARVTRQQTEQKTEQQELAELSEKRRHAFAYWLKTCRKEILGTPVDRYLLGRGIDLRALAHLPGALRFDPSCKHVESGRILPAMVAAMCGPDGSVVATHRTWLMPDGSGKADVSPVRKMWPSLRGQSAVIRLSKGEGNKTPEDAEKRGILGPLVICEGIEDGLSIALACPELRVWAAGSLPNLAEVRVPACCNRVIVAADNDWGKPQAEKLLNKAVALLIEQGRPVSIARSPIGKDANDALRGAA